MMNAEDVRAFVGALTHKEATELGATLERFGDETTLLTYPQPQEWSWPRQFAYRRECFCVAPTCIDQCLNTLAELSGEHVVNLFSPGVEEALSHTLPGHHVLAWYSSLLARDLDAVPALFQGRGKDVQEVRSPSDQSRFDSLRGISHPNPRPDPSIHNFYACDDEGSVAAKGQLIYLGEDRAYISDMFTVPERRRRGYCTAIIEALERKARELGARRTVLAPGLEASRIGLYELYGYAPSATRAVLVRASADLGETPSVAR